MFAFWFNTLFTTGGNVIEFRKSELDKANKDKSHKTFKESFKVTCQFQPLEVDTGTKEKIDMTELKMKRQAVNGAHAETLSSLTEKYPSLNIY